MRSLFFKIAGPWLARAFVAVVLCAMAALGFAQSFSALAVPAVAIKIVDPKVPMTPAELPSEFLQVGEAVTVGTTAVQVVSTTKVMVKTAGNKDFTERDVSGGLQVAVGTSVTTPRGTFIAKPHNPTISISLYPAAIFQVGGQIPAG